VPAVGRPLEEGRCWTFAVPRSAGTALVVRLLPAQHDPGTGGSARRSVGMNRPNVIARYSPRWFKRGPDVEAEPAVGRLGCTDGCTAIRCAGDRDPAG
jgi:hypothetical protein